MPEEPYHLGRAWYSLIVSELQILAAGIDIAIVSLLVHPIEVAFHINDVRFSVITVIPVAIGVVVGYYPGGLLADTFRRRDIVAIGAVIWTLGALLAARSDSEVLLFIARLLAGLGTAINGPAMFSMLTDAFPPTRRAFAVSIYTGGVSIGIGVGLAICGVLVEAARRNGTIHIGSMLLVPWQQCFIAVAAIGIGVLALVLTVPEPPRRERSASAHSSNLRISLGIFGRYLQKHWPLWTLALVAGAIGSTGWCGLNAWGPVYGLRHYGIVGAGPIALLGTFTAVGALLGSVVSGIFVQRGMNHGDHHIVPRMLIAVSIVCGIFALVYPFMPSWLLAVTGMGFVVAMGMAVNALMMMAIQEAASNEVRGQLFGFWGFIANIPSIVVATLVAFLASGILAKAGGLGPALAITGSVASAIAVLMLSFIGRPYEQARHEVHAEARLQE